MAYQPAIAERVFGMKYRLQRSRFQFCHAQVRNLPANRCGVYALWLPATVGDGYDCIYVGKSETCIRRRLLQHLRDCADELPRRNVPNPAMRRIIRTFRDIAMFSVAFTSTPEETDALETAVIRAWQPETNRNKL